MDLQQAADVYSTIRLVIQSGREWNNSDEHDESKDNNVTPKDINDLSNTSRLNNNEISLEIKRACGFTDIQNNKNKSVTSMIQKRQWGCGFSPSEKCQIGSTFLPNKMKKIARYRSKAFCGSYSTDGKLLVTASQDNRIRLYRTNDGKFNIFKKINAQNVSWSILDTAFSPDGNYIAYSSWSEALYLCPIYGDSNIQESLPLAPTDHGRFCIFSLVFSTDGREIVGAANDGCLYVYDRECHQCAIKIEGHSEDANTVAFADNTSQILYSGGDDGLCKVWDRRTLNEDNPHPVGVFSGHVDGITHLDSKLDSRYLITNSKDQTIKLWDVRAFSSKDAQETTRKAVANQNWDYRWQRVPRQLYKSSRTMLDGDTSVMTYRGHTVVQTLIRCHFSPISTTGQRFIYTGCGTGKVIIYDLLTGKIVCSLDGHRGCVRDVSWHPYHQEIISSSWDGVIGCWRYSANFDPEEYNSSNDSDK
ncbi:hypothetical protein HCN44_001057 [Aphidius gifuensis]|uniref:Uncharacterized protein n=1 Tax=Aphidius gifuensis TaxID=684658 RepID=A0A835CL82_APHGI|nr:DDB1- and CUL4-associated factor 11 isoform X2 [Aphidius gifuensis]KAF7988484.1 hypothetical protein HCN44_001057 [Aphidius gifuensis]